MKVIFLDFDGVLNSRSSLYLRTLEYPRNTSLAAPDPICVRLVDKLLEITQACVVVSSSWRNGYDMYELREVLREEFGLHRAYSTIECGHKVILDKTRTQEQDECRGDQIQDWLYTHHGITEYVIIDDDSDMLPSQMGNFVQCENEQGFRGEQFDRCLQLLKVPKETLELHGLSFLSEQFEREALKSKI